MISRCILHCGHISSNWNVLVLDLCLRGWLSFGRLQKGVGVYAIKLWKPDANGNEVINRG